MKTEQRITDALAQRLANTDKFLVEVKSSGRKIQVFLDSDTFVSIDDCADISRFLEQILETERLVPENYVLEVSSAGADMPLRLARQFQKHIGQAVEVLLNDGIKIEGLLIGSEEDSFEVEVLSPPSKKKKPAPINEPAVRLFRFNDIKSIKRKLVF
ncbi:MAG: ribosome maturation factor RimP [Sphingobacteriales bacterium]|nr:ribosome maturation factor RimP [Sphingobacteriales bacterium]